MAIAGRWTFESLGVRRRRAGGWGEGAPRDDRDRRREVSHRVANVRSRVERSHGRTRVSVYAGRDGGGRERTTIYDTPIYLARLHDTHTDAATCMTSIPGAPLLSSIL